MSLDGSRRVTQRTRAHIKPIAIFPIRSDDVCFARPPPAASDASPPSQSGVVPVAATDHAARETPAVEPATAEADAPDDAGAAVKIERTLCDPEGRRCSASPVRRLPRRAASSSSASQPPLRTSEPSRLATAGDRVKRGRGRPRKRPAPAEDVADAPQIRPQRSFDSAPSPPAPAANPRWQPWISLRRINAHGVSAEEESTRAADTGSHQTRQLQAPPARAVTRSGRASRPPSRYGLVGDVED